MERFYAFLKDEKGSATVEFVIWIPLFTFFLMITIDASVLWVTHSQMWNVARETARRITTGELASAAAADCYAMWQLGADKCSGWDSDWEKKDQNNNMVAYQKYFVQSQIEDNEARVLISVNIGNAAVFGFWLTGLPHEDWLRAQVIMRLEPPVVSGA